MKKPNVHSLSIKTASRSVVDEYLVHIYSSLLNPHFILFSNDYILILHFKSNLMMILNPEKLDIDFFLL